MKTTNSPQKQFPCSGCGATLEFNPKAGRLKCPYCGQEEAIAQQPGRVLERSFEDYVNANQTKIAALSSTAQEVDCPGCRAKIMFQPPTVAGKCAFCNTSIVSQPHTADPVISPEGILPFSVGQKAAREAIQRWLGSRWFAPNSLKKLAQQEGLQGMYLPFWTYDCQTYTEYRGKRGEYYYETETYTETNSEGKPEKRTRQVRHTRWYSTSGTVKRFFDDVLVPAVRSLDVERLDQLEPWHLDRVVAYDPSFLSGFKAQRYEVSFSEGFEKAKDKMKPQIESDIRQDIGGDTQEIDSYKTRHSSKTFKHLLLPVWIAAYRYKNKQYQVMVNAQTGEVLGDHPYSAWKIMLTVFAAILAIAGFLGYQQIQSPPRPVPVPAQSPNIQSPAPAIAPSAPSGTAPIQTIPAADSFRQAINTATQAANATQSAQTREQWSEVAVLWGRAIELLNQVPPNDPNFATAQQKIQEYQRNLNYARQQIERLAGTN